MPKESIVVPEKVPENQSIKRVLPLLRVFFGSETGSQGRNIHLPWVIRSESMNSGQIARVIGLKSKDANKVLEALRTLPGITALEEKDSINLKVLKFALIEKRQKPPLKTEKNLETKERIIKFIESKSDGVTQQEIALAVQLPMYSLSSVLLNMVRRESIIKIVYNTQKEENKKVKYYPVEKK